MKIDAWIGFWIFMSVLVGCITYYNLKQESTEEACVKNNGVPIYDQAGSYSPREMVDCKLYLKIED